ncbi:MAG: UDP-3-O-acyl-N-acetylglucosamine deacetylase [Phycisphaerales bacterium]
MLTQRTLKATATIQGTALFTATPSRCVIHPSEPNTGIAFLHDGSMIRVHPDSISTKPVHRAFASIPPRCSALTDNNSIKTVWLVEHILSALAGLGITNARIETNHHELPILDGSSRDFTNAILKVGIENQNTPIEQIRLTKPIRVEHNDSWIQASPADAPSYRYTIDYGPTSPITQASVEWNNDPAEYTSRIAHARTFCLDHEAEALAEAGLFKHLDFSDMLVLGPNGPIDNTLRDPHECALHKLLDLIGDVALLGSPICAKIEAHKSGHALAHTLVQEIVSSQ